MTCGSSSEIERRRSATPAVDPKPMSRASAILYAIGSPLTLVALVFLPVGRLEFVDLCPLLRSGEEIAHTFSWRD
jgi:hypothetical protein